jgi:hypothetical protein
VTSKILLGLRLLAIMAVQITLSVFKSFTIEHAKSRELIAL